MFPCPLKWNSEYNSLLVTSFTYFLCSMESSILHIGEWPYMHQIDEEATSSFFGLASSLSEAAHGIGAIMFAIMAHKMGDMKPALLTGRIITLLGCILYLSIEFFPYDKRYVQLTSYILFGFGFSTSPLLRALIVSQSSLNNRVIAFAFLSTALRLSFLAGALIQLCFSSLAYPGFEILTNLKVHIYTVPIWLALFTNIIVILVIIFKLDVKKKEVEVTPFSLSWFRTEFARLRQQNLPWMLIGVIILERSLAGSIILFNSVTTGPIMTAIYGKTGEETVVIKAIMQICQGLMATMLSMAFVFANVGKLISTRTIFFCAAIFILCTAIISFPYPNANSPIALFNETTRTGCDPEEYDWCFTNSATPFWLFTIPVATTFGLALPCAFLSVDTIYSRMLGEIDQSIMQAVLMVIDDVTDVIIRLGAAAAFTSFGYPSIAIAIGSIFIGAIIIWLVVWRKIKPYL